MSVARSRSYLYVPGDRPDLMVKALSRGPDALILDLEDAVADSAKNAAAECIGDFLAMHESRRDGWPEIWVRVNGGDQTVRDIESVAAKGLAGFCLAKVRGIGDVEAAAIACLAAEVRLGLADGSFSLMPLLETGAAVLAGAAIAGASPRVTILQIGEADLCADLNIAPSIDGHELLYIRSHVVLASAAAGIAPPVGPVSTEYADPRAFRESTLDLFRLGFGSRACIHPAQVDVVNSALTPTMAEREAAQMIADRYATSVAAGAGVVADESGRMIDLAVVRQALGTLSRVSRNENGEDA